MVDSWPSVPSFVNRLLATWTVKLGLSPDWDHILSFEVHYLHCIVLSVWPALFYVKRLRKCYTRCKFCYRDFLLASKADLWWSAHLMTRNRACHPGDFFCWIALTLRSAIKANPGRQLIVAKSTIRDNIAYFLQFLGTCHLFWWRIASWRNKTVLFLHDCISYHVVLFNSSKVDFSRIYLNVFSNRETQDLTWPDMVKFI